MNKIKNALYGTAASAMVLAPALVSAQGWNITNGQAGTNLASRTIGSQLNIILLWLLAIVAVLAVIGFVVAGVLYITAAGDEERADRGKKILLYTFFATILLILSYTFLVEIV